MHNEEEFSVSVGENLRACGGKIFYQNTPFIFPQISQTFLRHWASEASRENFSIWRFTHEDGSTKKLYMLIAKKWEGHGAPPILTALQPYNLKRRKSTASQNNYRPILRYTQITMLGGYAWFKWRCYNMLMPGLVFNKK